MTDKIIEPIKKQEKINVNSFLGVLLNNTKEKNNKPNIKKKEEKWKIIIMIF